MAKKQAATEQATKSDSVDDITKQLISDLNREFGMRVAYNLSETEAPTIVKRWLDTGSVQLNYAIRNAAGGGYPEGRIIEIAGPPSIGKSHLAYHAAAVAQSRGGIVIYIDTEKRSISAPKLELPMTARLRSFIAAYLRRRDARVPVRRRASRSAPRHPRDASSPRCARHRRCARRARHAS